VSSVSITASDAATGPNVPYRRRLVNLPLQRSLFAGIVRGAELLGMAKALPGGLFGARLNDSGDLFIDPGHVERLSSALRADLGADAVDTMLIRHRSACRSLLNATATVSESAGPWDRASIARDLRRLRDPLSEVLAYGVLARFVPDVLLERLRAAGDTDLPPFPRPSSGSRLTRDLAGLVLACRRRGYGPARLEAAWPEVDPDTARAVHRFSVEHTGLGPLAWDSPGFEDPAYVVRAARWAFQGVDPEPAGVAPPKVPVPDPRAPKRGLRALLAFWLDFVDNETWYVRRTFFLAIAPLAHRLDGALLTDGMDLGPGGPLFLGIDELTGQASPSELLHVVRRRRRAYLAELDGGSKSGETLHRLRTLLETR
jgi:hypothetical protein